MDLLDMGLFERFSCILDFPAVYRTFSRLIGGNVWRIYLSQYVQPISNEKVLDLGCGSADILAYLPDLDYTGVDINPGYIHAAKERFSAKGRFLCGDIGAVTIDQRAFTLVLATGILHHLDDKRAARLFDVAYDALAPLGRLVTYDGCYVSAQSRIAKWLLRSDRGRFIRTPDEYQRLARTNFSKIEAHLRHDLLRVPYTHFIMHCSN